MGIPMWWKRSGLSSLVLMADWRLLILPVIVLFEARRDASLTGLRRRSSGAGFTNLGPCSTQLNVARRPDP